MDQAQKLRDLMSGGERRAKVVAIASGKGGVGKSNIAVSLALALAEREKRVIIVDGDIGLANADVLLSVEPQVHLGHVLSGEVSALEALTPAPGGIHLLAGCMGPRHLSDLERTERDFLVRSFQELEAFADYVILDTAAGISRNVVQLASAADEVIVVTTPEPTAITDGYAVIKAITREKGFGRIRLCVNLVREPREASRVSERIGAVSRRFLGVEVEALGHVVFDEDVLRAVRRKRPFLLEYPRCAASECVRAMARKLSGEAAGRASAGFFRRFASAMGIVLG